MTGQAVGEILAFGVGVALSPLAIVAVVVMLVAPRGTGPASAFAAGWVTSLAVVTTVVLLVADEADAADGGGPATWVSVLKIVVAALLVVVGLRTWGRRTPDPDEEAGTPGWLRRLDGITVAKAAGLGALFNVAKPKNLLLAVAAGLAIAQVGPTPSAGAVAVATFVVLGSAGIAAPLVIHAAMPRRGRGVLVGLRDWMVRENSTIIAVLALVIAAKLLGDAVVSLAS